MMNHSRWQLVTILLLVTAPIFAAEVFQLDSKTREHCLSVLREAIRADEFWVAIHAAEALTLADQGEEVREFLMPKLRTESDDQKRCGLARELVRAGDRDQGVVMMDILRGANAHGHVHAAESLYKVGWVGDSKPLQQAFAQTENIRLRIMAAAALAKHGQGTTRANAFALLRSNLRQQADPEVFRISAWVLARIGTGDDIALIRDRLADADDELAVAFLQHALAALGDAAGRKALIRNLESSDPAIRTYAAVFAGESAIVEAAPLLIRQLDDENRDARVRAAQALLVLAQ
jgi:sialidase-1